MCHPRLGAHCSGKVWGPGAVEVRRGWGCPVLDTDGTSQPQQAHHRVQLILSAKLVLPQGNMFKKGQKSPDRQKKREQKGAELTLGPEDKFHGKTGISCSPYRTEHQSRQSLQPAEDLGHTKGKVGERKRSMKPLHTDHNTPFPILPMPLIAALKGVSADCSDNKSGRGSSWNKVELGEEGQDVFSLFQCCPFGSQYLNQ